MFKGRIKKYAVILLLIVMTLGNVSVAQAGPLQDAVGTHDIVIDNSDPGVIIEGTWGTTGTASNPERSIGSNYRTVAKADQNGQFIQYPTPANLQAGIYQVYFSVYRSSSSRSANVPMEIGHIDSATKAPTVTSLTASQKGSSGGVWISLGEFEFVAGSGGYVKIMVDGAESFVLADAVRLVPLFTPISSDATLSHLAVNPGALDFNPAVMNYTLDVVDSVYSSIDITPTVSSAVYKSLTVNGWETVSGSTYTAQLAPGENLITIQVTAEDNTVNTYTLLVNRTVPSSEARLGDLTLSRASLAFNPDTTAYQVQVGDQVAGLDVTPTVMSAVYQSLTVNGHPHASGVPWPVELSAGGNAVIIVVTAQDGTEKEYTLNIVRQGEAAVLSSLDLSLGALNFSPWRTEYSIYAGYNVESLNLTPASTSGFYERMTVNGVPHQSGEPYTVALAEGENPVVIRVYSNTGREMAYTVRIHRLDSEANAKVVDGKTVLPAEKLAEALGVKLLKDASGLLVFSDSTFDFSGSGDGALKEELLRLLNLRLTLDGEYASFFNPAKKDYRLLLPSDGHIPVIGLEHGGGTDYAVRRETAEPTYELAVNSGEVYTFTFAENSVSELPASSLAGIKMSIVGQEEEEFIPTWIPVAYVDSNDGYANVNTPNKTVDNDLNTRWSADSAGGTDWLRYDLGSKRNVHSMALAGYLGNERVYHFEVEISDDGQTWQPLLPMQHTSGTTLFPEIYEFPGDVETRYIRLLCYGYGPNRDGWNGVSEVRFYESAEQEQLDVSKWAEYFAPPDNKVGDQLQLQVKGVSPEGAEFALDPNEVSVRYFTDNAAVAQVDEATGQVTLTGAGTVRINAMAEQGDAVRLSSVIIMVSE